ncbi:MAG: glycosyltransferase [Chloroflexota bacterium]
MSSQKPLRFLVLSAYLPWHGHGGGLIVGNLLRQLSRKHSVTLLSSITPEEYKYLHEVEASVSRLHLVNTAPIQRVELASSDQTNKVERNSWIRRYWRKLPQPLRQKIYLLRQAPEYLYSQLKSVPSEIAEFQRGQFQNALEILQHEQFDIVLAEWPEMGHFGLRLPGNMLRVLDSIELRSITYFRYASTNTRITKKIYWWVEGLKMRRYEKLLSRHYDIVTAVSTREAKIIESHRGKANIIVNPVGLELRSYPFIEENRQDNRIVFLGRMSYGPNKDAVRYFLDQIYPQIKSQVQDIEFWVIGGSPPQDILDLSGSNGIFVTGYVPNTQDYLSRGTIFVIPMRQGSGIKIKALEAMACGIPIVATPLGVEGIEVNDEAIISHNHEEFADQVIALIHDTAKRRQLARKARALIEKRYDCELNVEILVDKYAQIMAQKNL